MVSATTTKKHIGSSLSYKSLRGQRRQTPTLYPTEAHEQMLLAKYLNLRFGDFWFHNPNENMAKPQFRRKLGLMGVRSGIPDILVIEPSNNYVGIAIELKRQKGGRLQDSQNLWLARFEAKGWLAFVAYGAQDAINKINEHYGVWK